MVRLGLLPEVKKLMPSLVQRLFSISWIRLMSEKASLFLGLGACMKITTYVSNKYLKFGLLLCFMFINT